MIGTRPERARRSRRGPSSAAREQGEYQATCAARAAKIAPAGKKPGGKVPQPPAEGPLPNGQVNLTGEESRIMPVAGGGFDQCANAQAAVAAGSMRAAASGVVQAPNGKSQAEPMLERTGALPEELGAAGSLLADRGYLVRFPITWNHVIEKESLKFKEVEHVLIEKVEQLFRDML